MKGEICQKETIDWYMENTIFCVSDVISDTKYGIVQSIFEQSEVITSILNVLPPIANNCGVRENRSSSDFMVEYTFAFSES